MVLELLRTTWDVAAIWLVSVSSLSYLVFRSLRKQAWRNMGAFLKDEAGASYALPYLMTFPIYLLTVSLVIQSTMIMLTKMGTMHAAHMAARSAVVWRSGSPDSDGVNLELAEDKALDAAVVAMTPFASGIVAHRNVFQFDFIAQVRALTAVPKSWAYDQLYRQLVDSSIPENRWLKSSYVQRKYQYSAAMTDVTVARHENVFSKPMTVRVSHRMPIYLPATGRILGQLHWSRRFFYRDVESEVTLPLETPDSDDRRLGIGYDSERLN